MNKMPPPTVREELDALTLAVRSEDDRWTKQILDRLNVQYPEVVRAIHRGLGLSYGPYDF
ncbi:hypothetical protein [Fodinicola acaciae]|uniref:hypothetical protein n=1 Tax=Fodinicola acaciae TaxID=2681555 RepID=UPI0013D7BBA2|nr:hypothetical protein [Fodinicola acaciae]